MVVKGKGLVVMVSCFGISIERVIKDYTTSISGGGEDDTGREGKVNLLS